MYNKTYFKLYCIPGSVSIFPAVGWLFATVEGTSVCYRTCYVHRWSRDHVLDGGNHRAWHNYTGHLPRMHGMPWKLDITSPGQSGSHRNIFLVIVIIRQDFTSLTLSPLEVKGQTAAIHSRSESRNMTFILSVYSCHLLPFRRKVWWFCCLVPYFPVREKSSHGFPGILYWPIV